MNTLHQTVKEDFRLQAILQIFSKLNLSPQGYIGDFKLCCNLHAIAIHCAKYDHPP